MRSATTRPRRILITGATGAIGGALAKRYASPSTHLFLHGRRQDTLEQVAQACREQGAQVTTSNTDLIDEKALFAWLDELCTPEPLDLVIANAGMNTNLGPKGEGEHWEDVRDLLDINLKVPMAMLNHLAKRMRQRGSGQLVLMSSLAAYHGLPITPSYSASKAGIKAYGEALRGWLSPYGVGVTVVMPGYVSSRMCHGMPGPKPFLWPPERAARYIQHGITRNRPRISFPFPLNFGCWWLAVLPASLSQRFLKWFDYGHRNNGDQTS